MSCSPGYTSVPELSAQLFLAMLSVPLDLRAADIRFIVLEKVWSRQHPVRECRVIVKLSHQHLFPTDCQCP